MNQVTKTTICVERMVNSPDNLMWLRIEPQHHYKEWNGCFSLYNCTLTSNSLSSRTPS